MIVRFLIVAVLINFSLVIGIFVIDAVQVLTNIFWEVSVILATDWVNIYHQENFFPVALLAPLVWLVGLVSLIFAVILSAILFSMLVALALRLSEYQSFDASCCFAISMDESCFTKFRTVVEKWWSLFFGWNLFLPVYLFFIYLGLLFLSKRNEIINSVIQVEPPPIQPILR